MSDFTIDEVSNLCIYDTKSVHDSIKFAGGANRYMNEQKSIKLIYTINKIG